MVSHSVTILLLIGAALAALARNDRVHDDKLSDKEPGSPDYDHEAFMGKNVAHEFDELSDDESKRRLGIIVDQIDKNNDGKVSEEELKDWIGLAQKRFMKEDADKQFEHNDVDKDQKIGWDEYRETAYGHHDENTEHPVNDPHGYREMMEKDERRFKLADVDGDGQCTLEEFRTFLHPEYHDHMKDVVIKETIDELDMNKDGFIDMEEYIEDMLKHAGVNGKEPEWIAGEREDFKTYRDANKDGQLDFNEVRNWIMPDDYHHAEAEARHLIDEADDDGDRELSKAEILVHHDTFVSSQATNWGEALKHHDEF